MPYQTGSWGEQAQERSKHRLDYFKYYSKNKGDIRKVHTVGYVGEKIANSFLTSGKLKNESGYDLQWAGLKVEVKTASISKIGDWYFSISDTQLQESDHILFICLNLAKHPERFYFIPTKEIKVNGLRVGKRNEAKLSKFLV